MQTIDRLRGEATEGRYSITDSSGKEAGDSNEAIFPIIRYDDEGRIHLLGTGFFITTSGIFVTAQHVLNAPFRDGVESFPIGLIHFRPDQTYFLRPILRFASNPKTDVAVGVAAPMRHNIDRSDLKNKVLTMDLNIPARGARIVTYAYPKHTNQITDGNQFVTFEPRFYDGTLEEYLPNGRDKVMLPGPCFHTSMIIHSGASGGPVFSPNGFVFGINSTGIDGTDISFVSSIRDVLDLSIDDIQIGNGPVQSFKIRELVRIGQVLVNPKIT